MSADELFALLLRAGVRTRAEFEALMRVSERLRKQAGDSHSPIGSIAWRRTQQAEAAGIAPAEALTFALWAARHFDGGEPGLEAFDDNQVSEARARIRELAYDGEWTGERADIARAAFLILGQMQNRLRDDAVTPPPAQVLAALQNALPELIGELQGQREDDDFEADVMSEIEAILGGSNA